MRITKMALLAVIAFTGGMLLADGPKPDAPKPDATISVGGILTEVKPKKPIMVWVDGSDGPVQFNLPDGFDPNTFNFPPKGKGIFPPDRVQITYKKGADGDSANNLLTIKKEAVPATGTVTGVVMFSNDFWVAVKPKVGLMDGYAIAGPGGMSDRLKALHKGDIVTIKFHTDVERHRIDTMQVTPGKAADSHPNPPAPGPA